MPALFETDNLICTIVDDIQTVAEAKPVVVAFSGGLDSTTVAALAKQALGADRVLLVTVNMGIYNYRRGNEIVLEMAEQLGLQQKCLLGQYVQHRVQANGPACNRCTREIKLGMVKAVARGRLVLTGANRSDTWGKMGIKVCNGYYSPLLDLEKPQVRAIADALGLAVPKIGEHPGREGCKLKHLLKPLAAPEFHGQAVAEANEVLLGLVKEARFPAELANVKIIGPLSRNRPLTLVAKAGPAVAGDPHARYWLQHGRLQPDFAQPIQVEWLPSANNRLHTFHVVDFRPTN